MIADLTKNYIDKKYELGKVDCFRLIYDYLEDKIELPKEFNGLTLETYGGLFKENPEKAGLLMVAFLETYLNEIALSEITSGDIVVLNYNCGRIFLGIVVANAKVLLVTIEKGVTVLPLKYYQIKRAFRCPQ